MDIIAKIMKHTPEFYRLDDEDFTAFGSVKGGEWKWNEQALMGALPEQLEIIMTKIRRDWDIDATL